MSTIPTIGEDDIRYLVGERSFSLGQEYFRGKELLAFLDKSPDTYLSVQIAVNEGEIDKALALVRPDKKPENSYGFYAYYDLELKVANAAEETRPRAAIEIYQNHVERLINQRARASYQAACPYLLKIRALFEKLGEDEAWTRYITDLRERNRSLRALKEEMAAAGL